MVRIIGTSCLSCRRVTAPHHLPQISPCVGSSRPCSTSSHFFCLLTASQKGHPARLWPLCHNRKSGQGRLQGPFLLHVHRSPKRPAALSPAQGLQARTFSFSGLQLALMCSSTMGQMLRKQLPRKPRSFVQNASTGLRALVVARTRRQLLVPA